jgi:hypothetical protein
MKNLVFGFLVALLMALGSCSTDVNLYADYKDVAIIYAMIDPQLDTNYVKIVRAFCGSNDNPIDANAVALIADSSNYPGKLEARFVELKSTNGGPFEPTNREFELDTITIHNKELGTFYAPDQKLYYTTERFNRDMNGNKYKYRIIVVKPNGDTLTGLTGMVGSEEFKIASSHTNFQLAPSIAMGKIMFKADGEASIYDVRMQFNYREQHTGQAMERKYVTRSFGTRSIDQFMVFSEGIYYVEYSVNWLFNALENKIGSDTVTDINHPNVVRYIDDIVVSISAGGHDLYFYYVANQAQLNSPISLISSYTNIDGGSGLFSSRTTIEKSLSLSASTKRDLFSLRSWGFVQE